MPIWDFKCEACNIIEEHLVKSDVVVFCPKCATDMDKLYTSRFSFNLKGDGFHKSGFDSYKGKKC